jgi:hypothetical protein
VNAHSDGKRKERGVNLHGTKAASLRFETSNWCFSSKTVSNSSLYSNDSTQRTHKRIRSSGAKVSRGQSPTEHKVHCGHVFTDSLSNNHQHINN